MSRSIIEAMLDNEPATDYKIDLDDSVEVDFVHSCPTSILAFVTWWHRPLLRLPSPAVYVHAGMQIVCLVDRGNTGAQLQMLEK